MSIKKMLGSALLMLAIAAPASAQIVGQGEGGSSAWLITGFVGLTDVTQTHNTIPNPLKSIQIGGASTNGGTHRHVGASNAEPGANDVGLFVRNITGMQAPGSAAPNLQHVIAGRDPVTNIVRQVEVLTSAPVGTEGGVITRPILPATAATSTKQSDGSQKTQLVDATPANVVETAIATPAPGARGLVVWAKMGSPWVSTVSGDVAHGVADSGGPIKIGCRARGTVAAVAGDARVDLYCDTFGRPQVTSVPIYTILTAPAPATCSVGVASGACIAANAARRGMIIVNLSTAVVCFGISTAAILNSGICLQPGATLNMSEYNNTTGAFNAIASAAASVISIQEFQ